MKNKFLFLSVVLAAMLFLTACGPKAVSSANEAPYPVDVVVSTPLPVEATVEPTPTATPTPVPPQKFEGYWLEFVQEVKDFQVPERFQNLRLMYERNGEVTEIANFCVHGSFWNTPAGFWFIIDDRATVYPSAPKGYKQVLFPHNFVWKYHDGANSYLHPAPWNDRGPAGCPLSVSHGCINMRPQDFDILHDGGVYTNPITGEVSEVVPITLGTPLVVVPTAESCTTLENCLEIMGVTSAYEAFEKYTCELCPDVQDRWLTLLSQNPILSVLDN